MKQQLDRTLGLFSALTISVGTMIGSAIFVLAGTSFEIAGPSATLAIFLSGIAAIFTALSFAELVTVVPTSGGGYAYAREASDNGVLGFICGWGFWLGYALSCGLFSLGFGKFINYFVPTFPPLPAAFLLVVYVTYINIKGVRKSGILQNIITTAMVIILVSFIVYGLFFVRPENFQPMFPNGIGGTFQAMGLLYMTYIGYGLVTTASEEVVDPEKTIPKAIMISIVVVIFIKTGIFLVGSGVFPASQLVPAATDTPLLDVFAHIAGPTGARIFAVAGIFAMISSINTAVMASSRTSFALARDMHLPRIFRSINPKTMTPVFSVLVTGVIISLAVATQDLQHISTVTSIFALTGYSLVNLAVIIFRKKKPDLKRSFRVPFAPVTPALGILINMFLVFQLVISDLFATIVATAILAGGTVYYYVAIPRLKSVSSLITNRPLPLIRRKTIKQGQQSNILVPLSNPQTAPSLLNFAELMARGRKSGRVSPLHVVSLPRVMPLDYRYDEFRERVAVYEHIVADYCSTAVSEITMKDLVVVFSRDTVHGFSSALEDLEGDFLLLGWHSTGLAYNMLGGIVHRALAEIKLPIGIFKDNGLKTVSKILYPYGGGQYSQETAGIVRQLAHATGASVTMLRVEDDSLKDLEYTAACNVLTSSFEKLSVPGNWKLTIASTQVEGILEEAENSYDLIVLGASVDWGIKEYVTGLVTDQVAEKATPSVLIVRGYNPSLHNRRFRTMLSNLKSALNY